MKNFKTNTEYQIPNNKETIVRVPSNYFIVINYMDPEFKGGCIVDGNKIINKEWRGAEKRLHDGTLKIGFVENWSLDDKANVIAQLLIDTRRFDGSGETIHHKGIKLPIDYMECVFVYKGSKDFITYKICEKELKLT